jgi:uncharacterized protein (TIGR02246 family)
MRHVLLTTAALAAGLLFVAGHRGGSQPPAATGTKTTTGADQTIRRALADYAQAISKGDLPAVAALWAADAEYTDESGNITKGRDAVAALFRKFMADHKGARMALKATSVRLPKSDVALVDGTSTITLPDGHIDEGRFTSVWIKADGKWQVQSARDLPGNTGAAAPGAALKELQWMVGDWGAEKGGVSVTVRWTLNRAFLLQEYKAKDGDGEMLVTQLVGYDPLTERIKSWTFDSKGGYGEGLWSRDGNWWMVETAGVLPDGQTGTARNVIRFVDDRTVLFQNRDREVGGQPIPDAEVKLVRKAAAPQGGTTP